MVLAEPDRDRDQERGPGMVLAEPDRDRDQERGPGMVLAEPDRDRDQERGPGMVLAEPDRDQERGSTPAPAPGRRALRVGFYDIERTLGKGNFAVVKLARHRVTRSRVAIKIIDKSRLDRRELQRVQREVQIMKLLNHPHIIKLYQVMESRDMLYIVTEFAQNGEMFDYLSVRGPLSEREARHKFGQILSAVEHCHRLRVVHRDLKTENLLLDANMDIKLADFGFGNFYKQGELLSTWCGSPPYAAPEVFEGKDYEGPHLDIWSLGVVLYVLVCGSLPFDGPTLPLLRQRVIEGRFRIPFFLSEDCESLIRRMLVVDPAKRITIPQIKLHRWMLGQEFLHKPLVYSFQDYNLNLGNYNQQVLSLMQTLGIDRQKTIESLQKSSYNHFAAIYYLLLERIKEHRQTQAVNWPSSAQCQSSRTSDSHSQTVVGVELMTPCLPVGLFSLPVPRPDAECELVCALQPVLRPAEPSVTTRKRSMSPIGLVGVSISGEEGPEPDEEVMGLVLSPFQPRAGGSRRHTVAEVSAIFSHHTAPDRGHQPAVPEAACSDSCLMSSSGTAPSVSTALSWIQPLTFHSSAPAPPPPAHQDTHSPLGTFQEGRRASDTTLTTGLKPPRFVRRSARARGSPWLYRSGGLSRHHWPPPHSLSPWDRPVHLLPEGSAARTPITTPGPTEGASLSHQLLHQHRELQLKYLSVPEAALLPPPSAVQGPVFQSPVRAVLQPTTLNLPSDDPQTGCTVPSPLSCSLAAFHFPPVFSEYLQQSQGLQADCEMEDLPAARLSKVVLVN
ncbi:serine/threonine-protein kinase SIK1 isoform X2 [Pristis pectinata]|uniref:serine/threonine-protein kinase SIK1 isoform X2 n=1 Tax=Pristis pectinata TaxID=685728 RepID=UPI00223CA7D8|nr:serine/threonine-protein kinase SIK1 isoform X2 [Pristis pectinata]